MKRQILFAALAAALLASCSKTEPGTTNEGAPRTRIVAKARGAAEITVNTKAPVVGTSLNAKTADVYTTTEDLDSPTDRTQMFTNAYARGTMTFDDSNYVIYNTADFGGLNGGNTLLPTDGSTLYMYGFYPAGWTRSAETTFERLSYTFDGHHDVMSTWLTAADNLTVRYNAAPAPDKADFVFEHLLTRYHIQVKANDAEAQTVWGNVQSVTIKEAAVVNRVTFDKKDGTTLGVSYDNDGVNTTPASFFKLSGALATPTYSDDKFEATDFASAFALTTAYQNACYAMVAPVAVDATTAPELTLVVKTITAAGKTLSVEVPVTLDQSKFTANGNSTRGFSISLALNFRVGVIQATAMVEEWKDYGTQYENVDLPLIKIGSKTDPATAVVGDFYFTDGSLEDKDATLTQEQKDACVGIVFWKGDPTNTTDGDPLLKRDHPGCCHGLVVALHDAGKENWSSDSEQVNNWTNAVERGENQVNITATDKHQGYANTVALKAYNAQLTNNNYKILPVDVLEQYSTTHPAPKGSSGWYVPSIMELKQVCWGQGVMTQGIAGREMLNLQIDKAGGTKFDSSGTYYESDYWSSTETYDGSEYSVRFSNGRVYDYFVKNTSPFRVRPLFAF